VQSQLEALPEIDRAYVHTEPLTQEEPVTVAPTQ
jgi:hypothetical protein